MGAFAEKITYDVGRFTGGAAVCVCVAYHYSGVELQQICTAGLDARAVTGTKAGEPWCWNTIWVNGLFYHGDLFAIPGSDRFRKMKDMDRIDYAWEYTAYSTYG